MKRVIPIFFACDDNFIKFTLVAMQSIIDNASDEYDYNIHVLTSGISSESENALNAVAAGNIFVFVENVTEYMEAVGEHMPIRDYYSHTTYYRMFIADMFPQYDKALYIDSDTVALSDVAELYLTDIGERYVGAVREQVMIQVDVFGEYVEKVLNIPRNQFFNAGVLLINCRQFREKNVLRKFVMLLHARNYVVTQDEDYLNVLCFHNVQWLDSGWNVEMFGRIECEKENYKILHYVMASKPWHYKECRLGNYFWSYASKTSYYKELCEILKAYTEEERNRDDEAYDRLVLTAKSEIFKAEGGYEMSSDMTEYVKAQDRLDVLEAIDRLESEGKFDVDVEEDPPTKILQPEDIDYLRKKLTSRIKRKLTFGIARYYMNSIIDSGKLIIKEIKGIENFRNLNSGAVITCNHFNAYDSFAMQKTYEASGQKSREFYRVIREGNYTNFPGFYGMLMRNCNTFPLSSNPDTMKKFIKSMDIVLQNGDFMLVYPEQSMWWNYRKPKPMKKGAFTFAARNNVPVLPCFITMSDSDVVGEDGFCIQEYTIHVSAPIYPDQSKTRAANVEEMREKNYTVWKQIYEETYNEPLVYKCGEVI